MKITTDNNAGRRQYCEEKVSAIDWLSSVTCTDLVIKPFSGRNNFGEIVRYPPPKYSWSSPGVFVCVRPRWRVPAFPQEFRRCAVGFDRPSSARLCTAASSSSPTNTSSSTACAPTPRRIDQSVASTHRPTRNAETTLASWRTHETSNAVGSSQRTD